MPVPLRTPSPAGCQQPGGFPRMGEADVAQGGFGQPCPGIASCHALGCRDWDSGPTGCAWGEGCSPAALLPSPSPARGIPVPVTPAGLWALGWRSSLLSSARRRLAPRGRGDGLWLLVSPHPADASGMWGPGCAGGGVGPFWASSTGREALPASSIPAGAAGPLLGTAVPWLCHSVSLGHALPEHHAHDAQILHPPAALVPWGEEMLGAPRFILSAPQFILGVGSRGR